MKKIVCSLAILLLVPISGCQTTGGISVDEIDPDELQSQKEQVIREASELFAQKKEAGMDVSNGPCLAEEIMSGWSVDTVHLPRTSEDDLPKNQCQYFRKGKTAHFIELSLDGDLVRAR